MFLHNTMKQVYLDFLPITEDSADRKSFHIIWKYKYEAYLALDAFVVKMITCYML